MVVFDDFALVLAVMLPFTTLAVPSFQVIDKLLMIQRRREEEKSSSCVLFRSLMLDVLESRATPATPMFSKEHDSSLESRVN